MGSELLSTPATSTATSQEPAAAPEPRSTVASTGSTESYADAIVARPGARDEILQFLHQSFGNAFVQQVMRTVALRAQHQTPGTPLPDDVKQQMGGSMGADFSAVRVHEGAHAEALGARAYAQGTDLHFAPGAYDPHSPSGKQLLGHELTHVVQQAQGKVEATDGANLNRDPSLERHADEGGAAALAGGSPVAAPTPIVPSHAPDAPIQRTEIDARNHVSQHWNLFADYRVNTHANDWLIALLGALWQAHDPQFTIVFRELVRGLRRQPGPPTDGYSPPILHEVYESLAAQIGEQHAQDLFAREQLMYLSARNVLAHYQASGAFQLPNVAASVRPGREELGDADPAMAVLALIPTHPNGKSPDDIIATYKGGFTSREAARRLGMSIGVNAFAGVGTRPEQVFANVRGIAEGTGDRSLPLSLLAYTWRRGWRSNLAGDITHEQLENLLQDLPASERTKVQEAERATIPHGLLREQILKAASTATVKNELQRRAYVSDVYYHIADDDAPSVKTPNRTGVYTEMRKAVEEREQAPTMLEGGYRVRREDNQEDPGDIPAETAGTELAELSSDIDHALRGAVAKLDPRLPYLSEANLLVNANKLDARVRSHDDQDHLTGNVFGNQSFESGNLQRFMGMNQLSNAEAHQEMGYVDDASLVTGTRGGGKRFYAYPMKRPENNLAAMESGLQKWDDVRASTYRNAISTSQNLGSLGNLAINLSMYFLHTMGLTVSSGTIGDRIENLVSGAGLDHGLTSALLDEPGFARARQSKNDGAMAGREHEIDAIICQTVERVLAIHHRYYQEVTDLLYRHIQDAAKRRTGGAM